MARGFNDDKNNIKIKKKLLDILNIKEEK